MRQLFRMCCIFCFFYKRLFTFLIVRLNTVSYETDDIIKKNQWTVGVMYVQIRGWFRKYPKYISLQICSVGYTAYRVYRNVAGWTKYVKNVGDCVEERCYSTDPVFCCLKTILPDTFWYTELLHVFQEQYLTSQRTWRWMNTAVFCDVTTYRLVWICCSFGGTYCRIQNKGKR